MRNACASDLLLKTRSDFSFFFNDPNYNVFNKSLLCDSHRRDLHIKQVNQCVHHTFVADFNPQILTIKSLKMIFNNT